MKRQIVSVALMGALLAGTTLRAEAGLPELFEAQIEKSRERTETIFRFEWPPVKTGVLLSGMIRLQGREEAVASYQAVYENAKAEVILQKLKTVPEWDGVEKMAGSTWRLWLAENRLRWTFLRESAFGMLMIILPLSVAVWSGLRQWENRKGEETLPSSSRLAVIPDHPLDFYVRLSDPKETRLKIGPGAENYDLQGNGWRTNGNHGAPLHRQAAELGFLSPFVEKIIAAFAASSDQPASLSDHLNVPGGLIEHTARTVEAMVRIAEAHPEEEKKVCYLMALCHDIGKLFAYRKEGDQWIDRKLPHDRISSLIVAGFPEFYTELTPTHREALFLALRYYHNPEELPTAAPPLAYTLLESMHKADAASHEAEQQLGRQQVEGVKPYLWEAFLSALSKINVNRYKGGYPEGFTAGEIVFVLEHALRERTLDQLPQELQQRLPIRRPIGKLHPAWPVLVEMLKEKKVLIEEVEKKKANPSALFNITASGTAYKCVVALSLEALTGLVPEVVERWRLCPPYEIRIAGGRYGEETPKSK